MRPAPGQVLHFSEDPTITRFIPHIATTRLYAYRLPAAAFHPIGEPAPHAHVATEPVEPIGPAEPVGDLIALHAAAGIQLRILPELHTFWAAVTATTLGFSGIRLHNAHPRSTP